MSRPVITKKLADMLALGVNGSYSNEGNALQHTLYDTALCPAAIGATMNYFVQPIGAAYGAGNKTITETNLADPGKLPNGQTFIVTAMGIFLKANTSTTAGGNALFENIMSGWNSWISNSVFRIVISGREYEYQVPGSEFLPAVPVSVVGTAAVQRSGDYWTSGWAKLAATPVVLGQMVSFSVQQIMGQQIAAALTRVNASMASLNGQSAEIQVRLRGFLTRSI